jgi:hypothetical protein
MGFLLLYLGRNEMAGLLRCILPQIEPCRIIGTMRQFNVGQVVTCMVRHAAPGDYF